MNTLVNQKFEKFINKYEERTICYLASQYSSLRDEEIRDIVQEAYVVLYNNLMEGKVEDLVYRYFIKICRNLCLKKIRENGGHVTVGINENEELFQDGKVSISKIDQILQIGEENDSVLDEMKEMVNTALDRMADKCKKLLWSFYADELSWATIAGMFELKNADTAKSSASRCRQRFKEIFNEVKNEKYGK